MSGVVGEDDVIGTAMEVEIGLLIAIDLFGGDADGSGGGGFEDAAGPAGVFSVEGFAVGEGHMLDFSDGYADEGGEHFRFRTVLKNSENFYIMIDDKRRIEVAAWRALR